MNEGQSVVQLFLICMLSLIADAQAEDKRYLIYGVNPGEGFNLRRDVYLRIANTVRELRQKGNNYTLVLPPWYGLPHWKRSGSRVHKWSEFFDLRSMNRFVPVVEFEDFASENTNQVDSVLYLQHYAEGWDGGNYELKYDLRPCIEAEHYYERTKNDQWKSVMASLSTAVFNRLRCLSIQGESNTLSTAIIDLEKDSRSVLVDRVETILHDHFGDKFYWQARRSMRYNKQLISIANSFRKDVLNSDDEKDKTTLTARWEDQKPKVGSAIGGNFLCVHWRRRDFVYAHEDDVPSIEGTAQQITRLLKEHKLSTVFVSTDAIENEFRSLNEILSESGIQVARFRNTSLSDGAASIVDQWICSHARYFIGTHVSTFSYRIHEDREILGFQPSTTFNSLCADLKKECEQPAKWTITY
ncbi:GDP-fucose protein O-fucosyltransferase 2 [Aphelenchoides besseyi]|nr:GDP-fucose protein O-fucosyltransferase 2 [Aphelenchoides besseyi]